MCAFGSHKKVKRNAQRKNRKWRETKKILTPMYEGHGASTSSQSETILYTSSVSSTDVPMDTQSDPTATVSTSNVQALGRLINKPGTKSKLWKDFKVYEKDHSRAHCCIANCKKPDFKISEGSTGHLQRHLAAHHREHVKESAEMAVRQFHDQTISNDL